MRFRQIALLGDELEISVDQVKYLNHLLTKVEKGKWLLDDKVVMARNVPAVYINHSEEMELKYIYTHPITKKEKTFEISRQIIPAYPTNNKEFFIYNLTLKSSKHYFLKLSIPHSEIFSIVFLGNLIVIIYNNDCYDFFLPVKDYLFERFSMEYYENYYMPDLFHEMISKSREFPPPSTDPTLVNISCKDMKTKISKADLSNLRSSYLNNLLEDMTEKDELTEFEDLTTNEVKKLFIPTWRANESKIMAVLHRIDSINHALRAKNLYRQIGSSLCNSKLETVLIYYL